MSAEMIDLQQFCSIDERRPNMHRPFSRGDYTWVTNGYILVRIPRCADVPENEQAPNVEPLWKKVRDKCADPLIPLRVDLPPASSTTEECETCDGRGTAHACPGCACECQDCAGKGAIAVSSDDSLSVGIGGTAFAAECVRKLLALPNVLVPKFPITREPMRFAFDGGAGLLMPLTNKRARHIEATPDPQPRRAERHRN